MMKISVLHVRENAKFVYYETPDMESIFDTRLIAIKLWIPKAEFGPEAVRLGVYPEVIEVGILDDSDKQAVDGRRNADKTLSEIIAEAMR